MRRYRVFNGEEERLGPANSSQYYFVYDGKYLF